MYGVDKEGEMSESKENDIEVLKVPRREAFQALKVLKLYTVQQDNVNSLILPSLDRLGWSVI
jgi:hypothetical protein